MKPWVRVVATAGAEVAGQRGPGSSEGGGSAAQGLSRRVRSAGKRGQSAAEPRAEVRGPEAGLHPPAGAPALRT